ncbi:MAG: Na+/H+ antiporter [Proteobacteria bacterium]|nr:Na+/H+ antiporter [Pseudomonadota bacterium]
METVQATLGLLLVVASVAAIARVVPVPLPLLQIAAGVLLSLLPAFANARIEPEIFFLLFIPPLLFGDAWQIPKRDLRAVLRPVLLLAFGLVLATVVVVGYTMHALIPALPLAAAFALGAIVSPTDALATSAMIGKLEMPRRMTMILSGESLINDASGLVALKFAVLALVTGTFSLGAAAADLVLIAAGGFVVGVALAWAVGGIRYLMSLAAIEDPSTQTMLSLLTPFAAYIAGDAIGASGVLAVVGAGLYAGAQDTRRMSVRTRQHAFQVWFMVLYAFNGLAFVLLGLSLRPAISALIAVESHAALATYALALWAVVTLVRVLWVYPAAWLPYLFATVRAKERRPTAGYVFVTGWAGLRGSVTMAAALALPIATAAGSAFPNRALLIFLAATTILLTLCINGLALPLLIRMLRIRGDGKAERERRLAEVAVAEAGMQAVRHGVAALATGTDDHFARAMLAQYAARVAQLKATAAQRELHAREGRQRRALLLSAITAERNELARLRDSGTINDDVAREVETRIDHAELLLGDIRTHAELDALLPDAAADADAAVAEAPVPRESR